MGWYSEAKEFIDDLEKNKKKALKVALIAIIAAGIFTALIAAITGVINTGDKTSAKQQNVQPQPSQQPSPQKSLTYREANKIYTHKSIVEDMENGFDKNKKVYFAYGEDDRIDSTAIFGNEWFTGKSYKEKVKTLKDLEQYEAKLEGEYYSFEIPDGAAAAQTPIFRPEGKLERMQKGFRFNYCQLDQDYNPNAWTRIENHRDKLSPHYIDCGKDNEGVERTGIIYKDL